MTVAVLFARADSHYKALPGCDVWDAERDARKWPGGAPVVAHPPCRAWASLRFHAKPRPDEKQLAIDAVAHVRRYGGVLEHPHRSTLWPTAALPEPGERDEFGGWTLVVDQQWWGHRAQKRTRLYIVGCEPTAIPAMPIVLGEATWGCGVAETSNAADHRSQSESTRQHRPSSPNGLSSWRGDAQSDA